MTAPTLGERIWDVSHRLALIAAAAEGIQPEKGPRDIVLESIAESAHHALALLKLRLPFDVAEWRPDGGAR